VEPEPLTPEEEAARQAYLQQVEAAAAAAAVTGAGAAEGSEEDESFGPPGIDRSGRAGLVLTGTIHGAIAMSLLRGAFKNVTEQDENGTKISLVTGATMGGLIPYFFTRDESVEITMAHTFWINSLGAWSLVLAAEAGAALDDGSNDSGGIGSGVALILHLTALETGWLTRQSLGSNASQIWFANMAGAVGTLGGVGVAMRADGSSNQYGSAMLVGGGLGLVGGSVFGPWLNLEGKDPRHHAAGHRRGRLDGRRYGPGASGIGRPRSQGRRSGGDRRGLHRGLRAGGLHGPRRRGLRAPPAGPGHGRRGGRGRG
jgi:hypothetical protein